MASLSWRLHSPAIRSGRQSMLWTKKRVDVAFLIEPQCRAIRLITASVNVSSDNVEKGKDVILKCISTTAEVSVYSISATHLVDEAQRRHNAAPTALASLGRALMGTLLLGALKDDAESVQITLMGDGPLGKLIAVASKDGWVKGFVENPLCDIPPKANNKLNVGAAVGSAIGLGVTLKRDGSVQSAHGFLVQVLPFCSEETLTKLETNIRKMRSLSDTTEEVYAQEILESILEGIGMGELYTLSNPRFGPCDISELRQRMLRAVALLGPSDVQKLLSEQGHVEVRCEFCAETLRFGKNELEPALEESTA